MMTPRSPSSCGRQSQHAGCRLGDAAKRADQVDLNDAVEFRGRKVPNRSGFLVAGGGFRRIADAGAINEDALLAECFSRLGEAAVHAFVGGDVHRAKYAAKFGRQCLAALGIEIEQRDSEPLRGQQPGGRLAEPRRTASDYRSYR